MSIPLYEPLDTLKQIDESIWIVDGEIIKMDAGPIKVPFSTRMTIIKLKDGTLWCHSPIKPTTELLEEINQLGPVKHLISPNKIHYAYIGEWQKLYPQAIAWASPGVEKRATSQNIDVTFDRRLEDTAPAEWSSEIKQLIFKGSRILEEVVFFHTESQTLILADLIENFEPQHTTSALWRTVHKLAGIADPDGQTPIDLRMTFLGQREMARASFYRMIAWQPERIILAHGRWYDKHGVAELRRAFRWLG